MTNDTTALQKIVGSREKATSLLRDLEGIEAAHEQAGEGVPLRWDISFEIDETDLPYIRDELRGLTHDE